MLFYPTLLTETTDHWTHKDSYTMKWCKCATWTCISVSYISTQLWVIIEGYRICNNIRIHLRLGQEICCIINTYLWDQRLFSDYHSKNKHISRIIFYSLFICIFSKIVTLTQNILYHILTVISLMEAENMKISNHTNSIFDMYDWPENSQAQLKHVTLMNKRQ
jgi:hypothetical protein